MRESHVAELLTILGLQRIKGKDDWVSASCPFSSIKHSKGSDSTPSFGVSVHNNKESHYNCFACHSHGPLSYLPTALHQALGIDPMEARAFIIENEIIGLPDYEGDDEEDGMEIDYAPAIPEVASEKFGKAKQWMYNNRGITPTTAKFFKLMHDSYEERLIIPIRDSQKRLVGLRGRYLGEDKGALRYRCYTELSPSGSDPKRFGVWFGDHLPLAKDKVIVLVEGEMDLILLHQTGKVANIRSSMGSQITKMQIRRIGDHNMPIVLFYDNDKAGDDAVTKLAAGLKGIVPVYQVRDYFGCNDPAEMVQKGVWSPDTFRVDKL